MFLFGSGTLIAKPFGPNAAANPTPQQLGTMQECSLDISASQKELYGKNQFPVAIARTAGKLNFKAKFANINAKTANDLFFGNSVASGATFGKIDELHTGPITTVTIAPPNSGTFVSDYGVIDSASGKQMVKVTASSEVVNVSYSVNEGTGVYTFHSAQTDVLISYSYHVTTGANSTVTNKPMGSMPVFEANFVNSQFQSANNAINFHMKFPQCIAAKFSLPFKNEDFTIVEFDFSAFADASGNIFYMDLDE